jgi:hypothetical protein
MHFVIEDETHSEQIADFQSLKEAHAKLDFLASIPWGTAPNIAPCGSGKDCERRYVLITGEYINKQWNQYKRNPIFRISASGLEFEELSEKP